MDMDRIFQQRWDFRRKDDEIDSMSDDSKSSSGDGLAGKKHKHVPVLSSPEKDDATDITQISQQKSNINPPKRDNDLQIAKAKKKTEAGNKRKACDEKSKLNRDEKRKRKVNQSDLDQDPALLAELKTFTDSLLKDLKVARTKMFVKMRRQMTRLVNPKPVPKPRRKDVGNKKSDIPKHQSGNKSGRKTQTRSKGGERRSNVNLKVAKDKREARSSAVKKHMQLPPHSSDQIGCSSHMLTLPIVLPQPQTENLNSDSSLCQHIQGGISRTNAHGSDKKDSLIEANNNYKYNYLSGIQPAEKLTSVDQINSKDMVFMDQQSTTSRLLSGLPAPLHQQWSNDGFNLRSQCAVENPGHEENTSDLRMNDGGTRFAGRSHILPQCFDASSNLGYDGSGGRFL